jgi:hypothetical protein
LTFIEYRNNLFTVDRYFFRVARIPQYENTGDRPGPGIDPGQDRKQFHIEPEFEPLAGRVRLLALPYKPARCIKNRAETNKD